MQFTDERLYVLGIGIAYMADITTGDILYWTDKMQEANVSVSASDNELRAGLGNGPAIIVPTDPNITVTVTAAEYSEYVKAASVGAAITQGAPVMVCREVTAEGPNLAVDLSGGTPVLGIGMDKTVCYVQEIGEESPVYSGGTAYELDASTGTVEGFTSESGKQYAVSYFVTQANATLTTVTSNVKGKVVRFVFSQPVYANFDPNTNSGDFWGWLHTVVPRLQLMPSGGGTDGSQTAFTVTGITGRAVAQDAAIITEECKDCGFTGLPTMYRILVPCDPTEGIDGVLGIMGGEVNIDVGESVQLDPALVIRGTLYQNIPIEDFAFASSDEDIAVVGENNGLVVGRGQGTALISVSYDVNADRTFTDNVIAKVGAGSGANPTVLYLNITNENTTDLTTTLRYTQSSPNAVTIDWGDGSSPERSADLSASVPHVWPAPGTYAVRMSCASGETWGPGANNYSIMGSGSFIKETTLTDFDFGEGCELSQPYAFVGCSGLKTIAIPSGTTAIPNYAFNECNGLESVTIPLSVTSIGSGAFLVCNSLTSVTLPSGLASLGTYVFAQCSALSSVNWPSGLTSIPTGTFDGCVSLTEFTIPPFVTEIGQSAFRESGLLEISVPNTVTTTGSYAFANCASLASADVACAIMGRSMFEDCTSLKACVLQNSVTFIGVSAFYNSGLEEINIPASVTDILSSAFGSCQSLSYATVPSTVTRVDSFIFFNCRNLKNVEFASVETGLNALEYCTGLEKVWLRDTVTTINGTTVSNSLILLGNPNAVMYVETDSTPAGWNPYWNYVSSDTAATVVYGQTTSPF